MNKRFLKTLKLYIRTAFNPIMIALALVMFVGIPYALFADPAPLGDKEYMSMIGTVGIGHIGIVIIQIMGCLLCPTSKLFLAMPDAKRFMTVIPIMVTAVLGILYDALIIIISVCTINMQTTADLMLMCSAGTVLACIITSTLNKKGLGVLDIAAMLIMFSTLFVFNNGSFDNGFGLSAEKAAVIAGAVYIAGIALNVIIMKLWWSRSDRQNKNINAMYTLSAQE